MHLQKCAEIIVAHLSYLNYTKYTVTVGFEHLQRPIKEMNFTVSTPADHSVGMARLRSSHSLRDDRNKPQHQNRVIFGWCKTSTILKL